MGSIEMRQLSMKRASTSENETNFAAAELKLKVLFSPRGSHWRGLQRMTAPSPI
jgi:hypothetical protein